MSDSYAEAMRKANEIREELIRREDNPPEAWEIEQFLSQSGWELLRTFLQGWLDNLAAKELAAKEKVQFDVVGPDGIRRPYARERSRTLMTPFGEVTANRMGYSAPGATSVFPLDKQLNWPQRTYSPAMQDRVALGVANDSYDKTVEQIELYTGGMFRSARLKWWPESMLRISTDSIGSDRRPNTTRPRKTSSYSLWTAKGL